MDFPKQKFQEFQPGKVCTYLGKKSHTGALIVLIPKGKNKKSRDMPGAQL